MKAVIRKKRRRVTMMTRVRVLTEKSVRKRRWMKRWTVALTMPTTILTTERLTRTERTITLRMVMSTEL